MIAAIILFDKTEASYPFGFYCFLSIPAFI